jgi:hypothetical protein
MSTTVTTDVAITDNGTIVTFDLLSPEAREWVDEYVDVPDYMWSHTGFHCEHRFAGEIAMGMEDAGLVLTDA